LKSTPKDIIELTNISITEIDNGEKLENHVFTRVSSKDVIFTNVSFNFSTFNDCYFRNCKFNSCKFVGCKFLSSNFEGSQFVGCKFEYSIFRLTNVEDNLLSDNCPTYENLKFKFARSLRSNFQSIGNTEGINQAILIELEATKDYLFKAWHSNESYYRSKYTGWLRLCKFFTWVKFKCGEFVWGNGESLLKLARAVLVLLMIIAVIETFKTGEPDSLQSYWHDFINSPQLFFSIEKPPHYSNQYLSFIFFLRLLFFGLFMAIVIKRFSKR
jgi:hypothetical protein